MLGWFNRRKASPSRANRSNMVGSLATNSGLTQIRLRFKLDDNNNATANFLSLFSGNNATNKPQILIEYYVP